jgi:GntR family transcriptional regulator/MocR family aminotransferase
MTLHRSDQPLPTRSNYPAVVFKILVSGCLGGRPIRFNGTGIEFGKALTPWLRLGYLVAPDRLIPDLQAVRDDLGTPVSGLDQQALATYLADGALRRHIARSRRDYRHTRTYLTRLLAERTPGIRSRGTDAGLHLVLELPDGLDAAEVVETVRRNGLLLDNLDDYAATPRTGPAALVLGYGDATLDQLDRAVTAIRDALPAPHPDGPRR